MWPFKKTSRQRRLEARRSVRAGASAWGRFRQAGGVECVLLAAAFYLAAAAMDLYPLDPFPYRLRQHLPRDVHARVRFRVRSEKLVEEAKRRARNTTPAAFRLDHGLLAEIAAELVELPGRIGATTQPARLDEQLRKTFALTDANQLAAWRALADANAAPAFRTRVAALKAAGARTPVVAWSDVVKQKPLWRRPERAILLTERAPAGGEGESAPAEPPAIPRGAPARRAAELVDRADKEALSAAVGRLAAAFDEPIRPNVAAYLLAKLKARPVYRYEPGTTQWLMNRAVDDVDARPPDDVYVPYEVGERIARRSVRTGEKVVALTAETLEVLRAEHAAFRAHERQRPLQYWGRAGGRAAVLLVIIALLSVYVARYEPKLHEDRRRAVALLAVLVAMLALNKVLRSVAGLNPHAAVLPVMMGAVVLTIAWDQRFALAVSAVMGLLTVLQLREGVELFLVLMAAGAAAVFQLGEIRTRSKLILVAAASAAVTFVGVWILSLAAAMPWRFALIDGLWATGCALLVGFIVQGLLPLIERIFRVATSMTLLEWCDASKPLLRRLAMEAPGTYNHSLQLGALCEAAAESVGARGLLARVGAYYHDIGKIHKPEYFIENQAGSTSKHAKLSPAMSLLIIIGHVKDGIEMAREYGLPKVLHEFIATHHGTTLVQYFYQAAAEQRKNDSDRAPDEMEFRYPGPKPLSKEPAILMLADAAESSVRAMSEPTPGRIENQVHAMVNRRLMDGQLDECELTLKEVHEIEASLIKSLCSMYHARIAYPTPSGQKPSATERHPRQGGEESAPDQPAPAGEPQPADPPPT